MKINLKKVTHVLNTISILYGDQADDNKKNIIGHLLERADLTEQQIQAIQEILKG
jgi:hypothetical protein